MKKQQLEESLRALDYYKGQNEEALRQALKKDEAVKKHTKATSKDAIKRERVEWLQRIVDEESTKPLQVPKNYVKGYTEQATEYSRQIANNNARRSYTLAKIEDGAKKRSTRREREKEYKRRWNATKGEGGDGSSALSNASGSLDGDDEDGALDEISQLAAQVRTQAERHAVDGSLPLESTGLGQDMVDEFSLVSTTDEPAVRQTVFRKKRTESSLGSPAQSYYTVKQTASEGDLSMGQSSEYGDDSGGPPRRSSRRPQSRGSSGGGGFNNTMISMGSMNSTMPRDHIEKLEMQVPTPPPNLAAQRLLCGAPRRCSAERDPVRSAHRIDPRLNLTLCVFASVSAACLDPRPARALQASRRGVTNQARRIRAPGRSGHPRLVEEARGSQQGKEPRLPAAYRP